MLLKENTIVGGEEEDNMAMEGKNIVKKSGIYLVGNLTSKLMSSLLLPVYAIYVTAAELGSYDMVVTVCGIIIPFAFMCLWEAILRFVLKETDRDKIEGYISTFLFYVALVYVVGIIGGFFADVAFRINYDYYYTVILYVLFFGTAQIFQSLARATKKNQVYVISGVTSTIVNFLGVVIFVCCLKKSVHGLLFSAILGQLSIIGIDAIGIGIWKYYKFRRIDFRLLKKMLVFSIPLIINQVILWLINGFGKVVININIGVEANGLYSFASKFSTLVTTLGGVIAMALFEEAVLASNSSNFGEKYGKAISNLNRMFYSLITIAFPAIIVFYHLFAKQEYFMSRYLVPVLLIYSIMMNFATNLGSVFQVIDKTKYQFITTLMGAIGSCGLSYVLVFRYDMYGVVLGQLIGSVILVASRIIFISKHLPMKIDYKMIFTHFGVFMVVVVLSINQGVVFNIFLFVVVFVVELISNRTIFQPIIKKVESFKR